MTNLRSEEEILNLWSDSKGKYMVSICCTAYNHELYIEDAITGFLMQETNFPFEILIHDDASTDHTKKIIEKYEKKYPQIIKPIYQTENQYSQGKRINYTFNYTRAKGKYIALCEGDDYWTHKDKLQKQVDVLENNEQLMLCIHATSVLNVTENIITSNKVNQGSTGDLFYAVDVINGGGDFGHTSSFVFRRDMIVEPPQWFLEAPSGDTPLRLLSGHLGAIYYLDENMSVYRKGIDGSWTNRIQDDKKYVSHWTRNFKLYESYNNFTEFKYSKEIDKMLRQIAYKISMKTNYFNQGQDQYIYSKLKTTDKLKLIIKRNWLFKKFRKK